MMMMLLDRLLPQDTLRHHRSGPLLEPGRTRPHPRSHSPPSLSPSPSLSRHAHNKPALDIPRQPREPGPALAPVGLTERGPHLAQRDRVLESRVVPVRRRRRRGAVAGAVFGQVAEAAEEGAEGGEAGADDAGGLLDGGEDGGGDECVGDVVEFDRAERGDADDGGDGGTAGRRGAKRLVVSRVVFCEMFFTRVRRRVVGWLVGWFGGSGLTTCQEGICSSD